MPQTRTERPRHLAESREYGVLLHTMTHTVRAVALASTMPDAFLGLMVESLEEYDQELWNRLRAEHMVHSDPAR